MGQDGILRRLVTGAWSGLHAPTRVTNPQQVANLPRVGVRHPGDPDILSAALGDDRTMFSDSSGRNAPLKW
jgi:hypothetical protein